MDVSVRVHGTPCDGHHSLACSLHNVIPHPVLIVTVAVVASGQDLGLCHLHVCISPPRKQSAASCSCLCLCYSSTDATRSAHQLTEDRCNLGQDNTKRSQTAPGNVHRKEWVQVEAFVFDN